MYKQIGHLTASTIDNICFVDTESTSTLVIIAGGASASITATMPVGVYHSCYTCKMVYMPTASHVKPYGTMCRTIVGGSPHGLLRHRDQRLLV